MEEISPAEAKAQREREAQRAQRYGDICVACGGGILCVDVEGEWTPVCSLDRSHKGHKRRPRMIGSAMTVVTKEQALERIEMGSRWPAEMTHQHKLVLASLAVQYGLDPGFGELMVYQGKPYVTLEGRLRKAHDSKRFQGYETRPMTAEEKVAYHLDPDDIAFFATVYRSDFRVPIQEWGQVSKAERQGANAQTPLSKTPAMMAEKRALHRALRRAFSLNLPGAEEQGDTVVEGEYRTLDEATGELTAGPAAQDTSEEPQPTPAPAQEASAPSVAEDDPSQMTGQEFWEAVKELGFATTKVPGKLGVKDMDAWLAGGKTYGEAVEDLRQWKG
jgi:hypothetical protein